MKLALLFLIAAAFAAPAAQSDGEGGDPDAKPLPAADPNSDVDRQENLTIVCPYEARLFGDTSCRWYCGKNGWPYYMNGPCCCAG
ncbi:uncharacterized protein CcaverHIS019_0206300 [Cutaneotrichosporon cavernicola]|uniref:Uncharacterized protein n=1 Tax=Cutaneotrichosporon cavernicola TaxID=279322 RepID=A0AA48III2_9TREE|nr:uncharacterized protein CcaverHIS019_0206300 [Cutaneotrichosporon cavernicola]BEI89268.1 hypothetical protein CcaverHIS019_0206300 [Cutaneotrichosporon cavernicola]BEI97044.1 hypothetical protein CcaverHIS631_0206330 [Cutaneotrichosporon cavernicola]BEJ04817.1 hypothetical protein CcaverHIS641_0206340 [Cutaneotrichosporon cavernicola]